MKTMAMLLLITFSTTTATFYNIKPHKLYKYLVEPLVDVAIRSVLTGSVIDPIGQFIGAGGKYPKHHHRKKYHQGYPLPIPYAPHQQYYHQPDFYHERDVLLNYPGCSHHHPEHSPVGDLFYPEFSYGGFRPQ
ncbi:uncharacterized protein LOC126743156 [Anthonomus grandis grandis]|uniref:uncharacterized protein LOC126743156 n=1 Tax=Anthonomus grandis grandis TaxID=2921223 RepID=UPI00216661D2|nr:uncharacterized protein LOC126743156 [Anthonomus grandis grandis]